MNLKGTTAQLLISAAAVSAAFFAGRLTSEVATPTEQSLESSGVGSQVAKSIGEADTSADPADRTGETDGKRPGLRRADGMNTLGLFGRSLASDRDLEALARQAATDPNPVLRRLAFSRLIEAMTPENAETIRAELVGSGIERDQWNDFNYQWGALAGRDAFDFASESEERDLEAVLSGWASARPEEALALLENLPEDRRGERDQLAESIVAGLSDRRHLGLFPV